MSRNIGLRGLFLMAVLLASAGAHADLTGAQKAYADKDFTTAFQLFAEVAQLGNVTGQENVAAMYVDGEGVKRDNVLGYAWATIARENGGNAAMQNIIDQLQPHLDDKSRARVKEITDLFGKAALAERLLPAYPDAPRPPPGENCRFTRPSNPDDTYPPEAARQGISGSVVVDAPIAADGRTHHPIVLYSVPENVFENAARMNAFTSGFAPRKVNGVVVPCVIRFKVKYRAKPSTNEAALDDALAKSRKFAEAGNPVAQSLYALLMMDRGAPGSDNPRDWFLKSAQAGVPFAQYVIGIGLTTESSALPDSEKVKGFAWLKLAAAGGQSAAKFALANYTLEHDADALQDPVVYAWLEDAAKAGHRDATLYLAALLAAAPDAMRRDPARALTLVGLSKWDFEIDPAAREVIAAAFAQQQKFDEAISTQQLAIRAAQKLRWDVAPMQARLAKYQGRSAWNGNLMFSGAGQGP
jgi:TonB family protein